MAAKDGDENAALIDKIDVDQINTTLLTIDSILKSLAENKFAFYFLMTCICFLFIYFFTKMILNWRDEAIAEKIIAKNSDALDRSSAATAAFLERIRQ